MARRDTELELATLALLERGLSHARFPVVMCSFGKDSLVALHLVRRITTELPVLFHRDPIGAERYAFAAQVAADWHLVLHDYPPARTSCLANTEGGVEIANEYDIGGGRFCLRPTGTTEPQDGQPYLCALDDLLRRPRARFDYPWDLAIHGAKSTDADPAYGPMPLAGEFVPAAGGVATLFPLRDWTDAEVWDYTAAHGLPIAPQYELQPDGTRTARRNHSLNTDYLPACTACLRPGAKTCWCPKRQMETASIAAQVPWHKVERLDYCT